ncbi:hypothetical protein [uncultured Algoriphagus sp.]|uniref:hypothetical protein n=1 Tax=uncultured Algoriphagus sp. TaxID=417365 RepID=UPI0030EE5755|tara:strand:- start:6465 stop:7247 length:783 start_codon:yes stop_codon:yes gene_type:complete
MSDSPIEKIHIDEFLTLVEGLEVYKSDRQSPPEPDFCAQTNLGMIGIEHTRLFKKLDTNSIDPVAEDRLADDVLNKANEIFQKMSDYKVHVTVSFRSDYGVGRIIPNPQSLQKVNKTELANQIAQFVLENIPDEETYVDIQNPDSWSREYVLPEIVKSVNIGLYSKMSHSAFGAMAFHWAPTLENGSTFFDTLKRKNGKPRNYQIDYFQIWLVMVTSPFNLTMDFDFNRSELPIVESPFDKVFIYRHGDKKYHELPKMAK